MSGLAGLYNHWTDPLTGEIVPNFTVITQNCNEHPLLSLMHRPEKTERRAVAPLKPEDWGKWLSGEATQAETLIRLPGPGTLVHVPENPEEEQHLPPELEHLLQSLS